MKKSQLKRVDPFFIDLADNLRREIEQTRNSRVPFTQFTRELAVFMQDEGMDGVMIRRAKRNRGNLR